MALLRGEDYQPKMVCNQLRQVDGSELGRVGMQLIP